MNRTRGQARRFKYFPNNLKNIEDDIYDYIISCKIFFPIKSNMKQNVNL